MSILNQNLLTLDFWQDRVTYGKQTVPIGTIGCAALNITDEQIAELSTLCQPLTEIILIYIPCSRESSAHNSPILAENGAVLFSGLGNGRKENAPAFRR